MESRGQWNKASVMEAEASVGTAFKEDGSAPWVPIHISSVPTHDITHTCIYILTPKFHLHEILLEKRRSVKRFLPGGETGGQIQEIISKKI